MTHDQLVALVPVVSKNTAQQDLAFGRALLQVAGRGYQFLTPADMEQVLAPFEVHNLPELDLQKLMLIVRSVELYVVDAVTNGNL